MQHHLVGNTSIPNNHLKSFISAFLLSICSSRRFGGCNIPHLWSAIYSSWVHKLPHHRPQPVTHIRNAIQCREPKQSPTYTSKIQSCSIWLRFHILGKLKELQSIEGLGFRPSLTDLTPEKCETEKEKNSTARKMMPIAAAQVRLCLLPRNPSRDKLEETQPSNRT